MIGGVSFLCSGHRTPFNFLEGFVAMIPFANTIPTSDNAINFAWECRIKAKRCVREKRENKLKYEFMSNWK